jgi:hypothetical protein
MGRIIILAAAVMLVGTASAPGAHAQPSAIEGVARATESGAPIAFALVRLVSADSTAGTRGAPPQGITSADGRFRFGGISAGSYRVQLLRIGFRPVLSDAVHLAAGETVQLPLDVASQPLQLPTVTVRAEGCVTGAALASHPQLLTVWMQARDGASIREGLMARYRFRSSVHEVGLEHRSGGLTPAGTRTDTVVSDPKYALSSAARRRAQRNSRGYAGFPNDGWALPNELDVLHDDFLRVHCLDPAIQRGDGEIGVRFRPLRTRRGIRDVGGTIWLDSASYLARRLELEYMEDDKSRGTVRVDYGDVDVAGGTLRMPVAGVYDMWPSRKNPAKHTEGTLTFTYWGFEEVRAR